MLDYYSSITLLSLMALGVLSVLIMENDRLPLSDKRLLCTTYALIALSAIAEWCGVQMNGREDLPKWAMILVKTVDYMLTPMAGGALVLQMNMRNRWRNVMIGILGFNVLVQALSAFNGWMIVVSESNQYSHGPLYGFYLGECLAIIGIVIIEFILYGKSFRRENKQSLYAAMLLVVVGIGMQELLPTTPRTEYIALTLGAALMFIHYSEFSQLKMDDHVSWQQILIDTDALTGLLSRSAYYRALKEVDADEAFPENFAAFAIDINGLKQVNDTLGHDAGDELIRGAAECIVKAMDTGESRCYRTGGDEFVVLTSMDAEAAEAAMSRLKHETDCWHGSVAKSLSVSAGYALAKDWEGSEQTAEALVRKADQAMYEAKAMYYQTVGRDRRSR